MKLTQSQLKRIIKEELKNALNEGAGAQDIADMAAALANVSAVQDIIAKAKADPKVMAAIEDIGALQEGHSEDLKAARRGHDKRAATAIGIGGDLLATASLIAKAGAGGALATALGPHGAILGLGGVALMALGALIIKDVTAMEKEDGIRGV